MTAVVALLGLRNLTGVGQSVDRLAQARLGAAATAAVRTLDDDFTRFASFAQGVGPTDLRGDRLALTARLLRIQIALPGTNEVFAATAAGRLIAASDPLPSKVPDLAGQDWFLAALRPAVPGMSVQPSPAGWLSAAPSVMLTEQVRDAAGTVVGLIGATLPTQELRRLLDRAPLPPGADLRLLGPGHVVLAAVTAAPPASETGAGAAHPAQMIARVALRGMPDELTVAAPSQFAPVRAVASMPQSAAWATGWPALRGDVAGFAFELLGLWGVLGLLVVSRGWLGRPAGGKVAGSRTTEAAAPPPPGDPDAIVGSAAPAAEPARPAGDTLAPNAAMAEGTALAASEQRRAEAEADLDVARQLIETERREHRLALATLGHDMRTPMQSVLGICDLLLDGALEDDQRHWVEQLRTSGASLLALLNGLLAIAGGDDRQAEATDLAGLLESSVALFAVEAGRKRLALVTAIDPAVRGIWRVDGPRVRQIVVNLLANAVSRTPAGRVELRAVPESGLQDGSTMMRITVADTGPGVPVEDQERVFLPFQRGDAAVPEGLGLGLALCRENARAIGGTLTLDSRPGEGARFTLLCPAEQEAPGSGRAAFAGRVAVLVGLAEMPREALRVRLEQLGFSVETAADGYLGLALAERTVAQAGVLDLLIVDLAVTAMAAEAFCMRLRSASFGNSLALIGLTDETAGPASSGLDASLPRTASTADIVAAVTALMAEQPAMNALLPPGAGVGGGRVLVVEDDETNRALLGAALARSGFTAFPAASGEEAVRMAEHDGLDAVLLDLVLPGMSGLETASRIRALPGRSASIPIIVLTARADATVEAECRAAGVTAMVAKPADLDRLAQRMRAWIAAAPRPAASGPGADHGEPASAVAQVSGPFLEAMVSEIGLERTRACVQEFLDEAETKAVRLAELLPGWESGAMLRLCDDLKGLADLFGAVGFSEVVEELASAVERGAREPAGEAMARLEGGLPALPEAIWACLSGIERQRAARGRRAA
ncbi:MAG: response regulator [Rhodospirillales bacterium]|nr:response regulator [Rhodospirillales bacterium]